MFSDNSIENDKYLTKTGFFNTISKNNFICISEYNMTQSIINELDNDIYEKIAKRCSELTIQFPDKRELFENYIQSQEKENDILENKLQCSILVLKMI